MRHRTTDNRPADFFPILVPAPQLVIEILLRRPEQIESRLAAFGIVTVGAKVPCALERRWLPARCLARWRLHQSRQQPPRFVWDSAAVSLSAAWLRHHPGAIANAAPVHCRWTISSTPDRCRRLAALPIVDPAAALTAAFSNRGTRSSACQKWRRRRVGSRSRLR